MSGDGKEKDVHLVDELLIWKFWADGGNVLGEVMGGEVERVAVVEIEVRDDFGLACPHKDIVLRVAEMGGETGAEVACTKDENFGGARGGGL